MTIPPGNLLGAARAEVDSRMLTRAFIETVAYHALTHSQDYNFVVGRRGTGKSALFQKLKEHYGGSDDSILVADTPPEHYSIEIQRLLAGAGNDYRALRPITRLIWRAHILLEALYQILRSRHFKVTKSLDYAPLVRLQEEYKRFLDIGGTARCVTLLREGMSGSSHAVEVPAKLAGIVQVDKLEHAIKKALNEVRIPMVVAYDGLDEGWVPDAISTAVLGGLALAAADLTDHQVGIYPVLFVRDNMFRSLAQLDNDFTRHIEGHTLRLHWDETSLLRMVAERLRIVLEVRDVESDIRVWNRFAQRGLRDREGFIQCLHHTLYRPRDILVLLNDAYLEAARQGREAIVDTDVESTAIGISQHRLDDLLKEYEIVLPGLKLFVSCFRARPTQDRFGNIVSLLEDAASRVDFSDVAARDFALFNSGSEIFSALYSVGFIGIRDPATAAFAFCHDGSATTLASVEPDRLVTVHPCYWKALDLSGELPPEDVVVQINDEYDPTTPDAINDFRTSLLGEIQGALPRLPLGRDGSKQFEEWVLRTVRVLFAGALKNPQLNPNAGGIQQRDVVATNMATEGFWKRILEDYKSRQVIFEVKNYEEIQPDDFRQALSYSSGEYGQFVVIVSRASSELVTEVEKGWIRSLYFEHHRFILILPAVVLARCVSKLRSAKKYNYTENQLMKRMDNFVRSYLQLAHEVPRFRKKRKKSKKRKGR